MKQRRVTALVGASLMTVALLSGCGAGSQTEAKKATKTECDFEKPASPITVNVLAYNSSAIDPFTNTMVASCSHNGVTVKHDPIDFGGQVQKTEATLGSKTGTYDILETYGFVIPGFASEDKLQPLDEYIDKHGDKYGLDGLDKDMLERMSYDGKVYAIPMQAQTLTLAYRKDVFDKLGLKPPTTFEEMRTAAKKIQDEGDMKYPLALPWLSSGDLATAYGAALGSLGKPYVDPDTKKPNFLTPESKQAISEMKSLMPYMDPQVTTFDQPKVQQQMYNGKAAMSIMFSGRMNDLTLAENSKFSKDFAFAAPPSVKEGGKQYGAVSIDGWSIPKNAPADPDLLFQLIGSAVSEKASKGAMPAAYPARTSVVTEDALPYGAAIKDAISNAPEPQPYPWVPAISNDTLPALAKVMSGKTDVDKGLQEMQKIAEKAVAESK